MMMTRRQLLAALTASVLAPQRSLLARDALPVRAIPGSDETLPVIGLGSTKPVRRIADVGTAPLEAVLRTLLANGGRVVDTAPRPEDIDREFGRVLQSPEFAHQFFLAIKVNATGKDAGIEQIQRTLALFGRQTVDLVQIESLTDLDTHWPTLLSMRERGEARYVGVTVAREDLYPALEHFMRREQPDFVQLNYSVVEHSAEERLLPLAADLGIAVLVNGPFMNGDYFRLVGNRQLPEWSRDFDCRSWAEFSLRYVLANPAVTCVLTETTSPEHMQQNIAAGFGPFPDAGTRERMRALADTF